MEFESRLLPDYARWSDGFQPPLNPEAYLSTHLSLTSTVFLVEIMQPDFIEIDGCVLLRNKYDVDNFREWRSVLSENADVERMINHLHLWELFEPSGNQIEQDAMLWLARRIACSWNWSVELKFPARKFTCEVIDDYGPTVVLYGE